MVERAEWLCSRTPGTLSATETQEHEGSVGRVAPTESVTALEVTAISDRDILSVRQNTRVITNEGL